MSVPEGLRHEIRVDRPAFDKRDKDPAKNYGIGSVTMSFRVIGPLGGIAFCIFTGWELPHVREELRRTTRHQPLVGTDKWMRCSLEGQGAGVEIHSKTQLYDGAPEPDTDECELTGGKCWGDTGYTAGDTFFDLLCEKGEQAVWDKLDEWYVHHLVNGGEDA